MKYALLTYPCFAGGYYNQISCKMIKEVNDVKDENADLIIFTGGADISPELYGEENKYSYTNPDRDKFEKEIFELATSLNKKILGVCRGHQLINALLGGKLVQDIEIQLKEFHEGKHWLKIKNKGIVPSFFSRVNSLHHQGVTIPGKEMLITSEYNGVIESTEHKDLPILTVQFHPEIMDNIGFFNYLLYDWRE